MVAVIVVVLVVVAGGVVVVVVVVVVVGVMVVGAGAVGIASKAGTARISRLWGCGLRWAVNVQRVGSKTQVNAFRAEDTSCWETDSQRLEAKDPQLYTQSHQA